MSILRPSSLYWLFLLIVIIALYFLKLRRKRYVVSSVMFWMQAIEDMKANVPFARFFKNLLLPLQIFFLLMVILGLARPAWRGHSQLGKHSIVIIDCSASMQAIDSERKNSRFQEAQSAAIELVDSLSGDEKMMLIATGAAPTIAMTFTADKVKLRDIIARLRVTDIAVDMHSALELANSMAKGLKDTEIIVLSDNAVDILTTAQNGGTSQKTDAPEIRYRIFGTQGRNVAITKFTVTRDENDSTKYHVFVELKNFSETTQHMFISLLIEGNNSEKHNITSEAIDLSSGKLKSVVLPFNDRGFDMRALTVELDVDDDLAVDNTAHAILHKKQKLRVLLASETRNPYLENVLLTNPNVQLQYVTPRQYLSSLSNDIIIFYNTVPHEIPDGNVIFINPTSGLPFMPVTTETGPIAVISVNEIHPVMRFVDDLVNLQVQTALSYELPDWGTPLVETTGPPLIWLGEQSNHKGIVFCFDAFDRNISDFALRYECPILMANCLSWLGPAFRAIVPDNVKAGMPVTINLSHPEEVENIIIKKPNGDVFTFDVSQHLSGHGSMVFTDTVITGVYSVFADDELIGKFAVNLLDERESDIMPRKPENHDEKKTSATTVTITYKELWRWFVLIGLLLLSMEWWVYHRRAV